MLSRLAERSHHAWSVHLEGCAKVPQLQMKAQHQGDKVHRTVSRLLFVTRVTGAARDEQLGEHKTFLKASRWVFSRAATGRGAGRAGCRFARARVRAEWLCQQQQAPPDMMTGQSIRTCLRREVPEVPTDHEAHSRTHRGQLRERVSYVLSNRASAGLQPGGRSGNTMIQSRRVHDRGKPSRTKPDKRCRTPFAVQTFEAKTPTTRRSQPRAKVDHTWHGGIHDHADDKGPTELWDHSSPRTVLEGGVFLRVGLEFPRPRVARERACGGSARRSLWLGVWCAASLGKFWYST